MDSFEYGCELTGPQKKGNFLMEWKTLSVYFQEVGYVVMFESTEFIFHTIKKVSIRKALKVLAVIFSSVPQETLNVLSYA
jgi:hypothetical protein